MSLYKRTTAAVVGIGLGFLALCCSDPPEPGSQQGSLPRSPPVAVGEVVVATTITVDSDEPVAFSPHTRRLLALYEELHSFKDDPTFHQVGFGRCCRFYDWQTRVDTLESEAGLGTLTDVGVVPGDLLILGMEYMRSKGRPTVYTETMEPNYESGLVALAAQ